MLQISFEVRNQGRGLNDITGQVARAAQGAHLATGLCHIFLHHTSASLIISENADSAVCRDLERFMARLVPDGDSLFEHQAEGDDDMPAHIRSVLTRSDLTVPVMDGRLGLGTWQGIWLWEHRQQPQVRTVTVTVHGG